MSLLPAGHWYFDSVTQHVLGFHHPLATSLRLVKEDTLFDSVEPVLRLILDVAKEAGSANSEVCSLKDSLTSLLTRQGKFLSAMDVCQSMIADDITRKDHRHERVRLNMNRLGYLYLAQRSYDGAEKMSLEVLSLALSDRGSGHPQPCAILTCERLGILYKVKSDYERSERCFRQAVDWFSKKFTVDDTDVMVYLYKNLLSLLEEILVLQERWDGVDRLHKDFPGFALGDVLYP